MKAVADGSGSSTSSALYVPKPNWKIWNLRGDIANALNLFQVILGL